jgi:Protein of unknown function (DUF1579)
VIRRFLRLAMPRVLVGAAAKGSAEHDAVAGPPASGPADMRALDVLLGTWRCTSVVLPPGRSPVKGVVHGTLAPVLGGAWYEWNFTQEPNEVVPRPQLGRYSFGWNPATSKFVAIYYDDRGNYLVETTPGSDWDDGHLRFSGTTTIPGEGQVHFTDDITSRGPGHFRNEVSITVDGVTRLHGTLDCEYEKK